VSGTWPGADGAPPPSRWISDGDLSAREFEVLCDAACALLDRAELKAERRDIAVLGMSDEALLAIALA
jgi:hypothetical protein